MQGSMAVAEPELPTDVVSALQNEGEDADAALARLFQEQEHAWFLACGGDAALDHARHDSDGTASAGSAGSVAAEDDRYVVCFAFAMHEQYTLAWTCVVRHLQACQHAIFHLMMQQAGLAPKEA